MSDPRLLPLARLETGVRAYHALVNANCEVVGDVTLLSKWDLMRVPNVGKVSINEIIEALAAHGLKLCKRDRFVGDERWNVQLTDEEKAAARKEWAKEPPKSLERGGMHISGVEADFLLYALDAYADTDVRGHVHNHHHKGHSLQAIQSLRDRLFACHEHPFTGKEGE